MCHEFLEFMQLAWRFYIPLISTKVTTKKMLLPTNNMLYPSVLVAGAQCCPVLGDNQTNAVLCLFISIMRCALGSCHLVVPIFYQAFNSLLLMLTTVKFLPKGDGKDRQQLLPLCFGVRKCFGMLYLSIKEVYGPITQFLYAVKLPKMQLLKLSHGHTAILYANSTCPMLSHTGVYL